MSMQSKEQGIVNAIREIIKRVPDQHNAWLAACDRFPQLTHGDLHDAFARALNPVCSPDEELAYGTAPMLGWLVEERGIEPHIPVFDKSRRTDGTFSRLPVRPPRGRLYLPGREATEAVPPRLPTQSAQTAGFFNKIGPYY